MSKRAANKEEAMTACQYDNRRDDLLTISVKRQMDYSETELWEASKRCD